MNIVAIVVNAWRAYPEDRAARMVAMTSMGVPAAQARSYAADGQPCKQGQTATRDRCIPDDGGEGRDPAPSGTVADIKSLTADRKAAQAEHDKHGGLFSGGKRRAAAKKIKGIDEQLSKHVEAYVGRIPERELGNSLSMWTNGSLSREPHSHAIATAIYERKKDVATRGPAPAEPATKAAEKPRQPVGLLGDPVRAAYQQLSRFQEFRDGNVEIPRLKAMIGQQTGKVPSNEELHGALSKMLANREITMGRFNNPDRVSNPEDAMAGPSGEGPKNYYYITMREQA